MEYVVFSLGFVFLIIILKSINTNTSKYYDYKIVQKEVKIGFDFKKLKFKTEKMDFNILVENPEGKFYSNGNERK